MLNAQALYTVFFSVLLHNTPLKHKYFFPLFLKAYTAINENGSQFQSDETHLFVNSRGNKRQFHLPSALFWGSMFGLMRRSMKRCLKKLLSRSRLDYEQLHTLLAEMKTVINIRPLTFLFN